MVESKAYKYSVYAKNIEVRWGSEIIFDGELENIGTKVWNSNRVSKHGQKKKIITFPRYHFFLTLGRWLLQKSKLGIDRLQCIARCFTWMGKCGCHSQHFCAEKLCPSLLTPHRIYDTWSFGFLWGYHFQSI